MKICVLLIILGSFVSCGKDNSIWPDSDPVIVYKVNPAESENYTYEIRGNSCTTGYHEFRTFYETCQALRDDNLNNDCAKNKREQLYLSEQCAGEFSS